MGIPLMTEFTNAIPFDGVRHCRIRAILIMIVIMVSSIVASGDAIPLDVTKGFPQCRRWRI